MCIDLVYTYLYGKAELGRKVLQGQYSWWEIQINIVRSLESGKRSCIYGFTCMCIHFKQDLLQVLF